MQRLLDSAVGVAKESVKTVTREAFNNVINAVNGASAFALALVPGRAGFVEGLRGWELRPTFKAPRLPRWMEDGVSSLNFIYDESDSDGDSLSEYESGREDELSLPSSPSSSSGSFHSSGGHTLRGSGGSRPRQRSRTWLQVLRRLLWLIFWPLAFLFPRRRPHRRRLVEEFSHSSSVGLSTESFPVHDRPVSRSSSNSSLTRHFSIASHELGKRLNDVMEYVTHLNDNRRRGIIEDLQLLMELAIDRVFETVRSILHAPFDAVSALFDTLFGRRRQAPIQGGTVETTTLGDSKAQPQQQRVMRLSEALNTDARTCEDIVSDAGYPFEAIKVTTKDGYVLTLERIPRRDSRKVVLLQHGLLDSSLGWVSNGVVGSQAFAAYDQGFDVWLGNMRGYASREHVNTRISAQEYWRYSVNEHGMYDIRAMVQCIHETKMRELRDTETDVHSSDAEQPYVLSGVAHSLGGAAIMLYLVTQCMRQEPHRFSRLILLSPAGFHETTPLLFDFLKAVLLMPFIDSFMKYFIPGFYIPTRGLRLLFHKLAQDFQNLPAVRALVQVLISSLFVGGDSSDWVGALRQPHYNIHDMPGLSYGVMKHLAQMKGAKRFIMYDYGSARANMDAYGQPRPIDIGAHYHLVDIPVDVVMGRKDHLIPSSMVKKHYQILKAAGRTTSIKEFEYAHLDFTFAQQQDLLAYVMARLTLPSSKGNGGGAHKSRRTPPLTVRTSVSPNGQTCRVASVSALDKDSPDSARGPAGRNGIENWQPNGKMEPCQSDVRHSLANGSELHDGRSSEARAVQASSELGGRENGTERLAGTSPSFVSNGSDPHENGAVECKLVPDVNGSAFEMSNTLKRANSKKVGRSRVTEIEEVTDDSDSSSKAWQREASLTCEGGAADILVQLREVGQREMPHSEAELRSFEHSLSGDGLRRRG